jgi:hypothetical protein
MSQSK